MQNYYLEAKKTDVLNNCFHELGWHNSLFCKESKPSYLHGCLLLNVASQAFDKGF